MGTSIVIADDHPVVLAGLRGLIATDASYSIVGGATDGVAALDGIRRLHPELALIDLNMPGLSGIAVLEAVRKDALRTRVVLLTGGASAAEIFDAVRLGAAGVLLKEAAADMLMECLRCVSQGGQWLASPFVREALEREGERRQRWHQLASSLTSREQEIVQFAVSGQTNKQIAFRLGVSEGTAKVHLNNIFRKLQVASRAELGRLATGQATPGDEDAMG
jgi:DNA-binding NarL/FixJ family response regulator